MSFLKLEKNLYLQSDASGAFQLLRLERAEKKKLEFVTLNEIQSDTKFHFIRATRTPGFFYSFGQNDRQFYSLKMWMQQSERQLIELFEILIPPTKQKIDDLVSFEEDLGSVYYRFYFITYTKSQNIKLWGMNYLLNSTKQESTKDFKVQALAELQANPPKLMSLLLRRDTVIGCTSDAIYQWQVRLQPNSVANVTSSAKEGLVARSDAIQQLKCIDDQLFVITKQGALKVLNEKLEQIREVNLIGMIDVEKDLFLGDDKLMEKYLGSKFECCLFQFGSKSMFLFGVAAR